ncbi:DUF349 domain-containing protein [Emticicia sp. BO119]|uniref:DUF349 domain-containing protein n=1 Tax=Emticicia sp. BO119 TaxID=2757768 RepID=UPI0015F045A1|nr:DUF349 domain-containing protein [Emticicia sp. BO119]MBA4849510.1 DUF349 domain-containing protein [Emticicia sp. BO119]
MTHKELDLAEPVTDAAEVKDSSLTDAEASANTQDSKEIMNELKDSIDTSTDEPVEDSTKEVKDEAPVAESPQETPASTATEPTIVDTSAIDTSIEEPATPALDIVDTPIENVAITTNPEAATDETSKPVLGEDESPMEEIVVSNDPTVMVEVSPKPVKPEEAVAEELPQTVDLIEDETPVLTGDEVDYSNFSKKDFVDLGEKLLASIKSEGVSISDVKNADNVMKEIKPIFDDLKAREKSEALKKYIADNGGNEGFEFKNDNYVVRFESLSAQIRDAKNSFFQKIERQKEDYFERKTNLLQRLREIVEQEEQGGSKNNWQEFKKLQEDWKSAGNVNSPHNTSLWSAFNALVDRYFSIRHIQNELKDLDRKKNLTAKTEIVERIEAIAGTLEDSGLSNTTLRQANDLLEEYKHIGPAQREAQDELWKRLKAAFDIIHNKRREQSSQAGVLQEEIYQAKSRLVENLKPYIQFNTDSINEWNAKTKEILAIQDQWNGIKGAMPKEKGKDISREFWSSLKTFFRNKGDFFNKLEAERESNLKAKTSLCEQVEVLLESGDFSPANTDRVVELQKTWKTIGHVPEKFKDKIYDRFKKACDAFFNGKRAKGNEVEKEYEANLQQKIALCEEIEAAAKAGEADLSKLAGFKSRYNEIGFVPRKEMQNIQRRFVDAINAYVKASSGVSGSEKEKMLLQNEVDVTLKGDKGNSKELDKKENDIRRKMKKLEDDINLWENNIEFFARSKNAAAVRAEYEEKIKGAEKELAEMKQKLKIIVAAN